MVDGIKGCTEVKYNQESDSLPLHIEQGVIRVPQPAIALNTKNCSTIEPARAAQAENNVTIETVKQIAVYLQAQIAQFGNRMEKLGAIENKDVQKYTCIL